MIVACLPAPPATNNLFFNLPRGGRAPTGQYKQWQREAGLRLNRQVTGGLKGPVAIEVLIQENPRRDIDGYQKALLDLLVKHGVIEDDRCKYVRKLNSSWSKAVPGGGVMVSISPVEEMAA